MPPRFLPAAPDAGMARILFAWEFGGDLGHVRRLVPLALDLRAMGHEVAVAFRDSTFLEAPRSQGIEAFIAPILRHPSQPNLAPASHSDILLNIGFADRHAVAGAMLGWRSLFDLVGPHLLVADYAPSALLAARLKDLRRVTIGTGFPLPPASDPLPVLRPWAPMSEAALREIDTRLVETLRAALPGHAPKLPHRAKDLFEAQAHLLCTFPDLDPFGPREGVDYMGPQGDAQSGMQLHWRREGTRIFAYLKPGHARFDQAIAALSTMDAEVIVAAPGLTPEEASSLSNASMRVVHAPVNLDLVLPAASLCVSHAGPGIGARCLAAGVPMAMLPLRLEQHLIGLRLVNAGSGVLLDPNDAMTDLREWILEAARSSALREAATRLAVGYAKHSFRDATRRTAQRIADIAGG